MIGQRILCLAAGNYDLDWSEAGRRFERVTAREPMPWPVRSWYSIFYLLPMARCEEARREAERVLQENPLDRQMQMSFANALYPLGKEEEALAAYHRACGIDPGFWFGWCHLALIHALGGRNVEARQCAERTAAAGGHASPYGMGVSAGIRMNAGETERAEELLATLRAHPYGAQTGLTLYHLVLGEFDAALECALRAVDERVPSFVNLLVRAHEKSLRKSSAWSALPTKLNLPEAR